MVRDHDEGVGMGRTALYVVLWLISIALIFVDIALVRSAYLGVAATWSGAEITTTAERIDFNFRFGLGDRVALIVMVIAGLVGVIVLERYFRHAAEEHALSRRGWQPLVILAGIAVVSLVIRLVL